MSAADGNFWIAMAFDAEDKPVFRVGQGHGIRVFDTFGKARGQRTRWCHGVQWGRGGALHLHFPRSKVFHMTYVAGVLMATEVDCDTKH